MPATHGYLDFQSALFYAELDFDFFLYVLDVLCVAFLFSSLLRLLLLGLLGRRRRRRRRRLDVPKLNCFVFTVGEFRRP